MSSIITRDAARAAGLKRYYTGKPCAAGHDVERRVRGWVCVECARLRNNDNRAKTEAKAQAAGYMKEWHARPDVMVRREAMRSLPEFKEKHRIQSNKSSRGVAEHELPPPRVAGHCDLCQRPAKLHWDHDHVLDELGFPKVETHRGWLCFPCNGSLGQLGDTVQSLARAIDYVSGQLTPGRKS